MTMDSQISSIPSRGMLKKYMLVTRLLDGIGPWINRLESVYHIVKDPEFSYVQCPTSTFLSMALVASSYWLDKELFDTSVIKKSLNDKTLNVSQKSHLYLLEAGSILMDKGFPLNQKNIDKFVSKDSPLYPWAQNFLTQCCERNAWSKKMKVVSHKKQSNLPCNQKIR